MERPAQLVCALFRNSKSLAFPYHIVAQGLRHRPDGFASQIGADSLKHGFPSTPTRVVKRTTKFKAGVIFHVNKTSYSALRVFIVRDMGCGAGLVFSRRISRRQIFNRKPRGRNSNPGTRHGDATRAHGDASCWHRDPARGDRNSAGRHRDS